MVYRDINILTKIKICAILEPWHDFSPNSLKFSKGGQNGCPVSGSAANLIFLVVLGVFPQEINQFFDSRKEMRNVRPSLAKVSGLLKGAGAPSLHPERCAGPHSGGPQGRT